MKDFSILSTQILAAKRFIEERISDKAEIGIVLGSGLGGMVSQLENPVFIPYSSIPFFPVSTVLGHSGELIFGVLNGKNIWVISGRFHYYEGYSIEETVFPVRVLKALGISRLIVSNAAGGLNPDFGLGEIMLIDDLIDRFPKKPLRMSNDQNMEAYTTEPFDPVWRSQVRNLAETLGVNLLKGVYVGTPGPSLETRAEIKYFRSMGGDAVGMSTVPEVVAASEMGIKVLGISVITNKCTTEILKEFTHEEVLEIAATASENLQRLIYEIVGCIN